MIYVCIPAHDEAATIGVLLWKTRKVLNEFGRDFRLVVHDDASIDDTAQVLERYVRTLPLTVLRSEQRIGYGRSVEALLRHVQAEAPYPKRDAAVVMQGDFTEDPRDVVSLVKIIEGGADIVAGNRARNGAPQPRGVKAVRWLTRTILRGKLAGAPVSDPLGGMRAYRVIVLKKALRERTEPLIRSDGWAANVELLGQLIPHARRISEVELEPRYDLRMRPSRFRPVRTLLSVARLRGSLPAAVPGVEAAT
ncbi:MAG TPA: glycosyltransferase family 2 protein [Longimicrobiales bacterium]|nr:glycosyltransferase family 2 protein [Longimicrobiales bacterium]